jgi:hypothetical protein
MKSLLAKATKAAVCHEPYPHLVLEGALDEQLCTQLMREFPPQATITRGQNANSNERFSYPAHLVTKNPSISPLWREFIQRHVSQEFLGELLALFDDDLRAIYPSLEATYGPLDRWRAGTRSVDNYRRADVLLDAQICVNTPVAARPSSVRGAHIDNTDKLFAGLYYLRHPEDDSTGGDLEIYRWKDPSAPVRDCAAPEERLELVKTVPYKRNVLVVFVNCLQAWHGVSVRSVTEKPRCFVNLVGEVRDPLFDFHHVGWRSKLLRKAKRIVGDSIGRLMPSAAQSGTM